MRRILLILAALSALLVLLVPPAADAKKTKRAKGKAPVVKLVSPMRVKVGKKISIRGRRFSSTRRRNTIVFRGTKGRVAFAKPRRAGHRKLVVKIPGRVERILRKSSKSGKAVPTRIRLRVISRRHYGKLTKKRRSPVIVSAVRAGKPASCGKGSDFDNDLLSNSTEARIKTDPCRSDTDGDGVQDGFEQRSALDLNQRALPYPGKRPYPNALDASDGGHDYDGDGLSQREEYGAWAHGYQAPAVMRLQFYSSAAVAPVFGGPYGGRPAFGNHSLPMSYSDGNQDTSLIRPGNPEYKAYLDIDSDGRLTDDERDADGDGLSNHSELHLLMVQSWYQIDDTGCEYKYKPALPRTFASPDYLDSDTDGDGVWDGNDDQDNDDVSNVDEILPPYQNCGTATEPKYPYPVNRQRSPVPGQTVLRNPYNPCQPNPSSRTCRRYVPGG